MEQESGRETAKVTGTTRERIENARKRLDIAEKWELPTMDQNIFAIVELADEVKKLSDMNASLGSMINNKIVEIKGLKSQLAELKEKMRWRNENVEPAPRGERVLVYCIDYDASDGVYDAEMEHMYCPDGELAYPYTWWRPLDLPGMGKAE